MTQEEDSGIEDIPYWLRINQHITGGKEEHDSNKRKREKEEKVQ